MTARERASLRRMAARLQTLEREFVVIRSRRDRARGLIMERFPQYVTTYRLPERTITYAERTVRRINWKRLREDTGIVV